MFANSFKLNAPLARNSNADLEDAFKVKKSLNQLGYMPTPSYGLTEYPDEPMFDGIKKFQKDKNLKVDGVMNPGGETENALASTLLGEAKPAKAKKKQPALKPLNLNFGLNNSVGIGGAIKAKDVTAAKNLLNQSGFLTNKATPKADPDPDFKFDIQRFQTAKGLKMDGVMNPGGETEEALGKGSQVADSEIVVSSLPPSDSDLPEDEKVVHPPVTILVAMDYARLKLNTKLVIRVQSSTLFADGVDIEVVSRKLNKDGGSGSPQSTTYTFAFAMMGAKEKTIKFNDTTYGWDVEVKILPGRPRSGNSGGFLVNVFGS